ncbi:unnamed protein product [Brassica oleracea var. botrytis]
MLTFMEAKHIFWWRADTFEMVFKWLLSSFAACSWFAETWFSELQYRAKHSKGQILL